MSCRGRMWPSWLHGRWWPMSSSTWMRRSPRDKELTMKPCLVRLGALAAMSSITLADDGQPQKEQTAQFKIAVRKKDDTVAVQSARDKAVFVVKSPSGISQAAIERVEG